MYSATLAVDKGHSQAEDTPIWAFLHPKKIPKSGWRPFGVPLKPTERRFRKKAANPQSWIPFVYPCSLIAISHRPVRPASASERKLLRPKELEGTASTDRASSGVLRDLCNIQSARGGLHPKLESRSNRLGPCTFAAGALVSGNTVDGRNPAPPEKPGNHDFLVNTNQQWLPMVSIWCEMDFGHPQ